MVLDIDGKFTMFENTKTLTVINTSRNIDIEEAIVQVRLLIIYVAVIYIAYNKAHFMSNSNDAVFCMSI